LSVMSVAGSPRGMDVEHEQFVRQYMQHESVIRGFARTLLPTWNDVDEVMQETFLVAWRKYAEFEPGSNFRAWMCAIARFEALRYLRQRGHEAALFSSNLIDLLESEAVADCHATLEREALEHCLAQLPERARQWLHEAYQPGVTLRQVAEQSGRSVEACYKMVQRLRQELLECIRHTLAERGAL
jgi:RNA polymerase sigma-70 factor (ECF subfamily)